MLRKNTRTKVWHVRVIFLFSTFCP